MQLRAYTNDIRVRRVRVQIVQLCSVWCRIRFGCVPCLGLATAPASELACSRFVVGCVSCRARVCVGLFVVCHLSVIQDRLQKSPPSVAITGLPIAIPLHTALRRFANPFRVASFGRADLTKFPWISPVTCEGDTALLLADCKEC